MKDSPFSLRGKSVLVTGASSGIGRAAAGAIAAAGGKVVATGRDEGRLAETIDGLDGEGHSCIAADLLDVEARRALVSSCSTLDGLVHCAGISRVTPVRYTVDKILDEALSINLLAPVHLTRELLTANLLGDGGSIVFLSSIVARNGWPGYVAYGAAKAGLTGVMKSLAAELARQKIRCNCLLPGMVKTPMIGGMIDTAPQLADEEKYPFGYGQPEDVAAAIVFFLADSSRWITGQELVMDGGATL